MIARALWIAFLILAALFVVPAQSSGPRVELSLIVTDKENKPVSPIRKADLHVYEGKVEQTILSVEPNTRPMDLVLAVDASGSQFREQFVIAYQSSNDTGKKGFRPVNVMLDSTNGEQRTAIAPHAYYFPSSDPPSEKREKKP